MAFKSENMCVFTRFSSIVKDDDHLLDVAKPPSDGVVVVDEAA